MSCQSWHKSEKKKAEIEKFGSDMAQQTCNPFPITASQVVSFFHKAEKITPQQENEEYGWVPCYVEGFLHEGSKKRRFKIRPTGVAQIEDSEKPEKALLLGCKECAKWFRSPDSR